MSDLGGGGGVGCGIETRAHQLRSNSDWKHGFATNLPYIVPPFIKIYNHFNTNSESQA